LWACGLFLLRQMPEFVTEFLEKDMAFSNI